MEGMSQPLECGKLTAFEKLNNGAYVFITRESYDIENHWGCDHCNELRQGNFCHECGTDLGYNVPTEVNKRMEQYRLKGGMTGVRYSEKDSFDKCESLSLKEFMRSGNTYSYMW